MTWGSADGFTVSEAGLDDAEAVLALQRVAYRSEAELLNDYSIPPLRETLDEVRRQCAEGVMLKAVDGDGAIVGSVRGRVADGTLHIGKLMVHPDCQGRGLGRRLLAEIEARCPQARYELFTSSLSARNLSLYEKAGYVRFAEKPLSGQVVLVYLEKRGV